MSIISPFRSTDRAAYRLLHGKLRSEALDPWMVAATDVGTKSAAWLSVSAVLAIFGDRKAKRAALTTLVATLTAQGLVNIILKPIIRRKRPFTRSQLRAKLLIVPPHEHSWPSGHSASSAAAFTTLAAAYPERTVPLLVLASAIAYSRVYVGVHYPFDVAAGAVVGGTVGITAVAASRLIENQIAADET